MVEIRQTDEVVTGEIVTASTYNSTTQAVDDIANLFTMAGQMLVAMGPRNWAVISPPTSLTDPVLAWRNGMPQWVEGFTGLEDTDQVLAGKLAIPAGNGANGRIQGAVFSGGTKPSWLTFGANGQVTISGVYPASVRGLRIQSYIDGSPNTNEPQADWSINAGGNNGTEAVMGFNDNAYIRIVHQTEPSRNQPRFIVETYGNGFQANSELYLYVLHSRGSQGIQGERGEPGISAVDWAQPSNDDLIPESKLHSNTKMTLADINVGDNMIIDDRSQTGSNRLREVSVATLNDYWQRTNAQLKGFASSLTGGNYTQVLAKGQIGAAKNGAYSFAQAQAVTYGKTSIPDVSPAIGPNAHVVVRIAEDETLTRWRLVVENSGYVANDDADNRWVHLGTAGGFDYYDVNVGNIGEDDTLIVERYNRIRSELMELGDPPSGDKYLGTLDGVYGYHDIYQPTILSIRQVPDLTTRLSYTGTTQSTGRRTFQNDVSTDDHPHGILTLQVTYPLSSLASQNMGYTQVSGRSTAGVHTKTVKYEAPVADIAAAAPFSAQTILITDGIEAITYDIYNGSSNFSDLIFRIGRYGSNNTIVWEASVKHLAGDSTLTYTAGPPTISCWIKDGP